MKENTDFRLPEIEASVSAIADNAVSAFVYYPKHKYIWLPEHVAKLHHCKGSYFNAPESIANEFVYKESRENYLEMYRRIDEGADRVKGVFLSHISMKRFSVSLAVATRDENGEVETVIGELHYESEPNVVTKIANGISMMYESIYYVWVKDATFYCHRENIGQFYDIVGQRGDSHRAWESYIEHFVVPEHRDLVRAFYDFDTLEERFADTNILSCKHKRIHLGWARGTYLVTKRDLENRPTQLLYVVSDINEEVAKDEQKQQAEFESEHDSLTGLFNRKTLDKVVSQESVKTMPVGFLLLDIDGFKIINDTYGHNFGDSVLCQLASMLESMFRKDDMVFRLGGDEFAILLKYSDGSAWTNIVQKLRAIHNGMREIYPKLGLTLSVGLCFSEKGFKSGMYAIADQALYQTKCSGKAGCIMFDLQGNEINHWFDDEIVYAPEKVQPQHEVGSWRWEVPEVGEARFFADQSMRSQLLFPKELSPEKAFEFFMSRTYTQSQQQIKDLLLSMDEGRVSEIKIPWKHPNSGTILIRFGGRKNLNQKHSTTYIGYIHLLEDDHFVADYNETVSIRSALEEHYYCNYYIDLQTKAFTAYKSQSYLPDVNTMSNIDHAFDKFLGSLIHEQTYDMMKAFLNTDTLAERLKRADFVTQEYFSLNKEHGWCRARFIVVKRDEKRKPTHVCFVVEEINKEKQLEIAEQNAKAKSFAIRGKMIHLLSRSEILLVGYLNTKTGMFKFEEREMDAVERPEQHYEDLLELNKDFISEKEQRSYMQSLSFDRVCHAVAEQGEYHCHFLAKSPEKKVFSIATHAMYYDDAGESILIVVEDVSEITAYDAVSGALNRDGFTRKVGEILETSSQVDQFYLLDFNIRQFRSINTQYDTYSGDRVLRDAADALKNSPLKPLAVCRNKDDRFYCLVKDETMSLDNLHRTLSFTTSLVDGDHQMEFYCGVYRIEDKTEPVVSICDRAMLALMKNKNDKSSDAYYIFDEELNEEYMNNLFVQQQLNKALREEEFSVMFQPIFDAKTKQIASAEALVRWNSKEKGFLSPAIFIPALEEAGKMYRVDEFVAKKVRAFQENRYFEKQKVVPVAMNLSRMDLCRKDFLDKSLKELQVSDLPAEFLRYEVTESAIMDIPDIGVQFLDAVRSEGSMIMVDDFGTGASSLKTIADRAYDAIKIDKSFIDGIGKSERVEAVILYSIALGKKLGLHIIAEGVETEEQYRFLLEHQCDFIQGYYFSKPLKEEEFSALLDEC